MKVGIIGLGSIGTRHAKNALALSHSVSAFDPLGFSPSDVVMVSHLEMLCSSDAILICTPAATHATVAQSLLQYGYRGPLFCEKPLALSVADCEVFRDWPHPTTMVGYNLRFHPIVRTWKDMGGWTEGAFCVRCDNSKYHNDIFELSHELDLACWLGVAPDHRGLIGHSDFYLRHWMLRRDGARVEAAFYSPESLGTQMYVDELAHFLDCAAKGMPTITPFADGIRVVQVCEDAMKMAGAQA
jgi:predicted dehydrogenase